MANTPQSNSQSSMDNNSASDSSNVELERAQELLVTHLRARGVQVNDGDDSDALASLMEAVEAFEAAVEARGGDLMVDEAPEGKNAQPDNPAFVLPKRSPNEAASAYTNRINAAMNAMQN